MNHRQRGGEDRDQQLIALLREKGLNDPEAKKMLAAWTDEEQGKVSPSVEDQIEFQRRKARIFAEAGHKKRAIEDLEDAREITANYELDDLDIEIYDEIKRIEASQE